MNFTESAAKPIITNAGIPTPRSYIVNTVRGAEEAASMLGPCVVKAQVPTGKRGKAGGIKLANTAVAAGRHAERILGMEIGGHKVQRLLVEQAVPIAREMYAAVLNDPETKGPLVLFSPEGGMDIEELAVKKPQSLNRFAVDIRKGLDRAALAKALPERLPIDRGLVVDVLARLYDVYAANDAELVEINPLVVTKTGRLLALDCKLTIDDSAIPRREEVARAGSPETLTALETRAKELGLKYIELDGDIGVLANGAGLTMTTMDAVRHFGGEPANFMEIGGDSYTKAKPALELVLANPRVKCLLVNFCGAFARTDVMAEGVVTAWLDLKPAIPIIFTIHGTGEDEAIALVKSRLGITPHDLMDYAVKAAVAAAKGASA
ncbi:MAG: acetate--CoA ligase family protein [Hyphomicrobiales bacterium]|nr:acetate--CoA ligase family protein [Hyphomicrobiales bacterium]